MSKIPETADADDNSAFQGAEVLPQLLYYMIDGFKELPHGVGDPMDSKLFHTYMEGENGGREEEYKAATWRLQLYPGGYKEEDKGNISIFLYLHKNTTGKSIRTVFSFSIGKDRGNMVEVSESLDKVLATAGEGWGYPKLIERGKMSEYVNELGVVWIACKLEHSIPVCDIVATSPPGPIALPRANTEREQAMSDLMQMYMERSLTDAVIEVDNSQICVHKVVLAARSSVFKKLFMSEFVEASTNVIEISDIDKTACEIMVSYMYGDCELPEELSLKAAKQVLHAADKYDVGGLKLRYEQALCSMISVETVVGLLIIGDRYGAETLKKQCVRYVMRHKQEVTGTEAWDKACKKYPQIIIDCINLG